MLASSFGVERLLRHFGVILLVLWIRSISVVRKNTCLIGKEMIFVTVDLSTFLADLTVEWDITHVPALSEPAKV